MTVTLWLLIYLGLVFAVGRLYDLVLGWRLVGRVFYPGMLVAALGRLVAALVGQQDRAKLDVMRRGGPTQELNLPGGHLFRFLWAVGPFVTSLVAFLTIWELLGAPLAIDERLPVLQLEVKTVGTTTSTLGSFLGAALEAVGRQQLGDWRFWSACYLGLALVITSAPTRTDLASVAILCGAVGLVTFGLAQVGLIVDAQRLYAGSAWRGFSLLLAFALLVLAVSALALLPFLLLRRSKEK